MEPLNSSKRLQENVDPASNPTKKRKESHSTSTKESVPSTTVPSTTETNAPTAPTASTGHSPQTYLDNLKLLRAIKENHHGSILALSFNHQSKMLTHHLPMDFVQESPWAPSDKDEQNASTEPESSKGDSANCDEIVAAISTHQVNIYDNGHVGNNLDPMYQYDACGAFPNRIIVSSTWCNDSKDNYVILGDSQGCIEVLSMGKTQIVNRFSVQASSDTVAEEKICSLDSFSVNVDGDIVPLLLVGTTQGNVSVWSPLQGKKIFECEQLSSTGVTTLNVKVNVFERKSYDKDSALHKERFTEAELKKKNRAKLVAVCSGKIPVGVKVEELSNYTFLTGDFNGHVREWTIPKLSKEILTGDDVTLTTIPKGNIIWQTKDESKNSATNPNVPRIDAVEFDQTSGNIIVLSSWGRVVVFNTDVEDSEFSARAKYPVRHEHLTGLSMEREEGIVCIGGLTGELHFLDVRNKKFLKTQKTDGIEKPIVSCCIAKGCKEVIFTTNDNIIFRYDGYRLAV